MKEELDYRRIQLRPQLLEAVKEARASAISARISSTRPQAGEEPQREPHPLPGKHDQDRRGAPEPEESDGVALYDKVTVFLEDEGDTEVYQVVTTMRQDALHGLISKESPLGKALLAAGWGRNSTSRSTTSTATTRW